MNKAITDGLVLMPPAFTEGLDVWSSENGRPGDATYDGATNAAFVPADQDFAGCLEMVKTDTVQKLRYMGETPIIPGCYLRVSARVKAISGNLPKVRIAAWAGKGNNVPVGGLPSTGPEVTLTSYGEVTVVTAIIGTGTRGGVDMAWGTEPVYAHVGLDLTGANGGVVRVDDIVIEDVTSVFHRQLMDWVDVRDFGAKGDGTTNDLPAFEAADAAAIGRQVLVPAGTYKLNGDMTFENSVRFEGQVSMAAGDRLVLRKNFEMNAYIDAFGDELLAFKKGFQALLNFSDHNTFDLNGRRIEIDEPIDMQAAVGNQTSFATRRVIRNGQFNVQAGSGWNTETVTSQASYSTNNSERLTNVANVANIKVGSLVTGNGVGREVYVRDVNVAAGEVTLSQALYGAPGNQTYTFTRFKYVLDFSGFASLTKFVLKDIEFRCAGLASAIMLAPSGQIFTMMDCVFGRPKDRGITSIGNGCQGMHLDRCDFVSNESSVPATDRTSVGFNMNSNDGKIRENRFVRFGHTGILSGTGHVFVGNHWFQGDNVNNGPRMAGIVFCKPNMKTVVTGNYIDNSFFEWTNEHDPEPDLANEFTFGGLSITGNIFTANDVAPWFSWIIIKPYGSGHYLQGVNVVGNTFKVLNGDIERVERVDDSIATLDMSRSRNVTFLGNTFNSVDEPAINPVTLTFSQNTPASTWTLNFGSYLPFGGWSRTVPSLVSENIIRNGSNTAVWAMPSVTPNAGSDKNLVQLNWPEPVKGVMTVTARCDNPY